MPYCPTCGASVADTFKFCVKCGNTIPVPLLADAATEPIARRVSHLASSRHRRLWMISAIVAVVAVAGLSVTLALKMQQLNDVNTANALSSESSPALLAAKSYAVDLASYDYRHLDADFGIVLAHSTPSFQQSFTRSSNALKSTLIRYKATADARVVAAGVVSATTSQAVVLVFLDQTVDNSNQKKPTTDRSQIQITLVSSPTGWLIDQVTTL